MRRENCHVLRKAFDYGLEFQRKNGRPRETWNKEVVEESVKVYLGREDTLCQLKLVDGINQITTRLKLIQPP